MGSILLSTPPFFAQNNGEKGRTDTPTFEIKGKIVDDQKNPLFYAIGALYQSSDSSLVTGATSDDKGRFSISTKPGKYYLKISYLSFKDRFISNIVVKNAPQDIGEIRLKKNAMALDEVEITATQNLMRLELDKKVIHVSDQNTNAGESAVEILENTPSVQTDIDGNVTLRGSASYTLLINGVPTAMDATNALQTIPASSVESVEIITNPSAKYDAEGSSGIINIITKKNSLEGFSLVSSITGGTYENYRGDIAISYGKKNVLINTKINANQNHRPRDIEKIRTTTTDTSVSVIKSEGEGAWKTKPYSYSADLQWTPENHTITLAGSYTKNKMVPYFYLNFEQFEDGLLVDSYLNRQDNIYDVSNSSISLYYNYKINGNTDHLITFKAISNQHDVDQLDSVMYYNASNEFIGGTKYRETGPSDFVRFNLDYEQPLGDAKLEMGGQAQIGSSADDGRSFFYDDSSKTFLFNDQFSSKVAYVRDIYAGYAIFKSTYKQFSYQVGLRGEYTYRTVSSENFPDFATINRMDWFPSAHFSYDLGNERYLMFNYSRRIQRPRSWDFEPFVIWETDFNVRSGNPDLTPEYIHNAEINWTRPLGEKGFLTVETYFKKTFAVINRVSSVYEENVIITRPYNTGKSNSIGIEPSIKYYLKNWWEVNNAFNIFYNELSGEIDGLPYGNTNISFTNRLTNTFSLGKDWKLQVLMVYQGPFSRPQGDKKGYFVLHSSLKKTFKEGKYALNLQGNNILGTKVDDYIVTNQNLHLNRINTPKFPMIKLTFSLRLNNYKKIQSHHEAADEF